jgi:hypothetical protein
MTKEIGSNQTPKKVKISKTSQIEQTPRKNSSAGLETSLKDF